MTHSASSVSGRSALYNVDFRSWLKFQTSRLLLETANAKFGETLKLGVWMMRIASNFNKQLCQRSGDFIFIPVLAIMSNLYFDYYNFGMV